MELILAAVLLAIVMAVLAYPLYAARPRMRLATDGTLGDLVAQRDGVYATLRDLELDYQLGKLDEADYRSLREKNLARAALLLQQLDARRGTNADRQAQSDEIEREVAALRQNSSLKTSAPVNGNGAGSVAGYCTRCGRPYQQGDRFCGKCGHAFA